MLDCEAIYFAKQASIGYEWNMGCVVGMVIKAMQCDCPKPNASRNYRS